MNLCEHPQVSIFLQQDSLPTYMIAQSLHPSEKPEHILTFPDEAQNKNQYNRMGTSPRDPVSILK